MKVKGFVSPADFYIPILLTKAQWGPRSMCSIRTCAHCFQHFGPKWVSSHISIAYTLKILKTNRKSIKVQLRVLSKCNLCFFLARLWWILACRPGDYHITQVPRDLHTQSQLLLARPGPKWLDHCCPLWTTLPDSKQRLLLQPGGLLGGRSFLLLFSDYFFYTLHNKMMLFFLLGYKLIKPVYLVFISMKVIVQFWFVFSAQKWTWSFFSTLGSPWRKWSFLWQSPFVHSVHFR